MSINTIQSNIDHYSRELQSNMKKIGEKRKKMADAQAKASKARTDASKSKSATTIKSKLAEAERRSNEAIKLSGEIASLEKKQAEIQKKLNDERTKLTKEQSKQEKKESEQRQKEAKKQQSEMKKIQRSLNDVQQEQRRQSTVFPLLRVNKDEAFDVFISHASEDKASFVDNLVKSLQENGVKVWCDKLNIGWGQSLRTSIEIGLQRSKYAIVVLSPNYFRKFWTNQELNGLFVKETEVGQCILPIWYNITYNQIREYSLILADRLALDSSINSIDEIVTNVKNLLNNE